LWLAYAIRFDFDLPLHERESMPWMMGVVIPVQLICLYLFRQFQLLPAYFGLPTLVRMFWALFISAGVVGAFRWQFGSLIAPPRGVILLDFLLALGLLTSVCMLWRTYRHKTLPQFFSAKPEGNTASRRVAIVGAGHAGMALARELQTRPELGFEPVAFFDDDRTKWNARISEVPVLGPPELLKNGVVKGHDIQEVILSMPSAPASRIRQIVGFLRNSSLKFKTVPSLGEMALGKYQLTSVRPVQIEDLLGREPVELRAAEIRQLIQGRCVMVTGAGGSIGLELCRQIAAQGPCRLLMVERSEVQMFVAQQDLIRRGHGAIIQSLVADILDEQRMRKIFSEFRPEIVFHAAAHKHVPMMESQPGEAIRNNSVGTARLAALSVEYEVDRFVLISTDKAIHPTSVMGATKRLAEMILQDLQACHEGATRFMAVRFGNVLGSSGSVIPLFREQIASGGPVTITHPDMTRYFMTIPEAVGLVLQTSVLGAGGEIFVLDMGEPVRILDLATQMIKLSGLEPHRDIQIEFVGVRPGEKLFEQISYLDEAVTATSHPKIMRLRGAAPEGKSLHTILDVLMAEVQKADASRLKYLLGQAVPEYRPSSGQTVPAPVAPVAHAATPNLSVRTASA
jgi:FlaA1/EpsC-like NDP-sugar epimerase